MGARVVPENEDADRGAIRDVCSPIGVGHPSWALAFTCWYRLLGRLTYRAPQAYLTIVDPDVETANWIGADPGLVGDRGAIPAVVRKRYEDAAGALPAFRKLGFHFPIPSPPHSITPSPHRAGRTP